MFKNKKVMPFGRQGFTLLEILLVVAAIAILAGIVILAINPGKQLAETRNAQRWSDVNSILNGAYQYSLDHNGDLPTNLPRIADCEIDCASIAANEICTTGGNCTGANLDTDLVSTYLTAMPEDPNAATADGTAYFACEDSSTGRVTVCAGSAEEGATIEVTR